MAKTLLSNLLQYTRPAGLAITKVMQLRIVGVSVSTARGMGTSQSSVEIKRLMKKLKRQKEQRRTGKLRKKIRKRRRRGKKRR